MTCHEVDELIAAYALGALPQEVRDQVEEHLRTCAAHEDALRRLVATASVVARDVEDIEPPAGLRAAIMTAVRADEPEPAVSPLPPVAPRRPSKRWWLPFSPAVAVLGLLVAGLLAWNVVLQFSSSGGDEAFVRYMRSEDDLHGWVYYVEEVGVITVQGLQPLAGDRTYQAWAIVEGELVNLGVIPVSSSGDGFVLLDRHVSAREPVFITIEPPGGSAVPTGTTVLTTERLDQ